VVAAYAIAAIDFGFITAVVRFMDSPEFVPFFMSRTGCRLEGEKLGSCGTGAGGANPSSLVNSLAARLREGGTHC
jgi:hypothetical protein